MQPWEEILRHLVFLISLITEPGDQLRRATQKYDHRSNPKTPPPEPSFGGYTNEQNENTNAGIVVGKAKRLFDIFIVI